MHLFKRYASTKLLTLFICSVFTIVDSQFPLKSLNKTCAIEAESTSDGMENDINFDINEHLPLDKYQNESTIIHNNLPGKEESWKSTDSENFGRGKTGDMKTGSTNKRCDLPRSLIEEIRSYKETADKIIATVFHCPFKGRTYRELAYFVDKFGSRLFGTTNLEKSIDFMMDKMKRIGLENVHGENAKVPRWVRGKESATLIHPIRKKLALLGLGLSVGTPAEGITAEVLVVHSFDELQKKGKNAKGKIVVFNEEYKGYPETVNYRTKGASEVAKVGGVASLIRSITPFSINSPHTGQQVYDANVTQIPTACITIEDAQLLDRIQQRGEKIIIELKMDDYNLPPTTSRNAVGEIKGREKPDEVVVVSGHIDSWDVGQGAMDDGGGVFISVEALAVLKFLKLTPKRTLRAILWTAEEPGLFGVNSYINQHKNEMDKFNVVFESDIGTFRPFGLDFFGSDKAGCIIQEVLQLLAPINTTTFRTSPSGGVSDINSFIEIGVPALSLYNDNGKYFYYHHTEADTMTVENSHELDLSTALWAVSSYVLADLSVSLPRK